MKKKILLLLVVSLGLSLGTSKVVHAQTRYKEKEVNQYGTITYEHFRLLEALDGKESETSSEQFNQTFFISKSYTRGISSFYLLKNSQQQEVGYVSASSVTLTGDKPEGVKRTIIRSKEILREDYPIYTNFSWYEKQSSTDLLDEKVKVKGVYHHFDGEIYYALYDMAGKWIGLVDQKATEEPIKETSEDVEATQESSEKEDVETEVPVTSEDETAEETEDETSEVLSVPEPPMETMRPTPNPRDIFSQHFMSGNPSGGSMRVQPRTQPTIMTPQPFQGTKFSSKQEFVEMLARDAQVLGKQYNIYPSVMIAQAILESGYGESQLTKEANNFYGMKFTVGVDEGKFERYDIYSDEFVNGRRVSLPATFRKYPTAKDSLEDYAKKIAYGLNWDKHFYRGAWRDVAATYQEATRSLTGKYATDPQYDQKLNQIIANWNLNQYD